MDGPQAAAAAPADAVADERIANTVVSRRTYALNPWLNVYLTLVSLKETLHETFKHLFLRRRAQFTTPTPNPRLESPTSGPPCASRDPSTFARTSSPPLPCSGCPSSASAGAAPACRPSSASRFGRAARAAPSAPRATKSRCRCSSRPASAAPSRGPRRRGAGCPAARTLARPR